ncbi:adenosylcobalamin-dependent ribonucleoside-diphosphate reductase, partial [Candidatus Dojkabacteria bacterium]|nr:adenosylcobalamin-dependent ribonucleoside-diphosphate reductase [Candidatus Dojkabacteria bacterium]
RKIFVTTHDIEPEWHVKMQAASQENVDAAVSKTINLPADADINDVRQAYIDAWKLGCKGITIYRDGSKQFQVLENVSKKKDKPVSQIVMKADAATKPDDTIQHILTDNALQVLEKRAFLKDEAGNVIESAEQLFRRIANHIASAESSSKREEVAEDFFNVMNSGEFYCGGTLLWAGMGPDTIMSKCLVLPIDDSIDSIFKTLNWNIQCLRRGVGTGFNFSKLRSSYSRVKTTGELAAGPIEYLRMFNRAQDTIRGRGGRGLGSMAILNANHPNIEDFIECKDDLTSITHYNISIGASDEFMNAVKNDADWNLVDPHDKKVYKTVKARELFEKIAKHAWKSGDPGMYFLDTAEKTNSTPELGTMDATNPCGEQPLIPFETCNMGHVNLSVMVEGFPYADNQAFKDVSVEQKLKYINWNKLARVTATAVRFLDNIIDVNNYPIDEIREMTRKTRNIGVGVMGFADLLIKLGIEYGSEESIQVAEKVMGFVQDKAHIASEALGKEKGNFPAFNISNWAKEGKKNMRNVRVTTIAPTGTISIVANCNPGIEPVFALGYRRKNSMGGTDQEIIEHLFEKVAKVRGFYSKELITEVASGKHIADLAEKFDIPADVIDVFTTTHEIEPEKHVQIQAAFQKFVD